MQVYPLGIIRGISLGNHSVKPIGDHTAIPIAHHAGIPIGNHSRYIIGESFNYDWGINQVYHWEMNAHLCKLDYFRAVGLQSYSYIIWLTYYVCNNLL